MNEKEVLYRNKSFLYKLIKMYETKEIEFLHETNIFLMIHIHVCKYVFFCYKFEFFSCCTYFWNPHVDNIVHM